jgi:RNA polymerase subunit RPABC4/transcription elongation factor Spt4
VSVMHCRECGRALAAGTTQCPYCGALPQQAEPALVPCKYCGAAVSRTAQACPTCGASAPGLRASPGQPHRGALILTFGILGIACCTPFGIAAWIMGNRDLGEIAAGRMDPAGQGITQAGRICGIVATALLGLQVLYFLAVFAFAIMGEL